MWIKTMVKRVIALTKVKQILPIQHNVAEAKILEDKVAVIIGGSGGIGVSIAKSFSESGCKVVLCGTNETKLEECVMDFEHKENVSTKIFDISDIPSIHKKVMEIAAVFGHIDILVNSAGVHTENVDFFTVSPKEYDRVMDINIKGLYFACREFAAYMIKNSIGTEKRHILLISSSRGSEPAWSPYGISKWALNGLTMGLARILLPYGIVVNGIAPGSTATEMIGIRGGDSIYSTENIEGRLVMPDEVANIAKVLVSSAGDMIVGETIHISGGRGIFDIR